MLVISLCALLAFLAHYDSDLLYNLVDTQNTRPPRGVVDLLLTNRGEYSSPSTTAVTSMVIKKNTKQRCYYNSRTGRCNFNIHKGL